MQNQHYDQKVLIAHYSTGLNFIFLIRDNFSGRNDVMSDKVDFRPNIRQKFFY